MELPASIATNAALARQNVTLSVIRQNAQQDQAIANILDNSIRLAPINNSRGVNINFSV